MDKNKYQNYLQDNAVIKRGTVGFLLGHDTDREIVITFFFSHIGTDFKSYNIKERLQLGYFPFSNLIPGIKPIPLKPETLILVNADDPDYAICFKLLIEPKERMLKLTLEDGPEVGEFIMTEDEKNGITIFY